MYISRIQLKSKSGATHHWSRGQGFRQRGAESQKNEIGLYVISSFIIYEPRTKHIVNMTAKCLVLIADGTEEMEAVIIIDVLRRGGVMNLIECEYKLIPRKSYPS
jgi:hypothetical protein